MEATSTQLIPTDNDLRRAAQIQLVIDGLAAGRNITESCDRAGIAPSTWRKWKKDGQVADVINTRYNDITTGLKDVIADGLISHVKVLLQLSMGKLPADSDIDGTLAARDVVAAGQQLFRIWQETGGDVETKEREQERLLDELRSAHISITQVRITTVNEGTMSQPQPVPAGIEIIEGEYEDGS